MTDDVLIPLADRVIVEPSAQEEVLPSGLFIPEMALEKPQQGKVIAVGDGKWSEIGDRRLPLSVSVGDVVVYAKYSGVELKTGGKTVLILSEKDILAIAEKMVRPINSRGLVEDSWVDEKRFTPFYSKGRKEQ